MKNIVDTVNALRGDLGNINNAPVRHDINLFRFMGEDGIWATCNPTAEVKNNSRCTHLCTIQDFNQCVAEMTEGLFVPLSDLNKRRQSKNEGWIECGENGLDEVDVEKGAYWAVVNGISNGWDCEGKVFLVFYDGSRISNDQYSGVETHYMKAEVPKPPVPKVELEDGAVYQFTYAGVSGVGFYRTGAFHMQSQYRMVKDCTNIIKLVPESK